MNILVINSDCLLRNSSANLCHLAYIKGLINRGDSVTVLSGTSDDIFIDNELIIPKEAKTYFISGVSLYEKISQKKYNSLNTGNNGASIKSNSNISFKSRLINRIKSTIISFYGPHGIYKTFVNNAKSFSSNDQFDYVISVSTPPSSHLLAYKLIKSGNINANHWIQIWEDPWYGDTYGFNNKKSIFNEEKKLLSYAEYVCYVSPLTLANRQEIFPESAHKMYWQPLPYYYKDDSKIGTSFLSNSYGYFGDYSPSIRDLQPFYKAAKHCDISVNICGNPSGLFESFDSITINPRLTLDKLKPIEDKTNVLVFLCNKQGGQIPGKIYQYSATYKTILFILDGTDEEKKVLKKYFEKFNRYVFCENTVEDITRAIKNIENGELYGVINRPLNDFEPKRIVDNIINLING